MSAAILSVEGVSKHFRGLQAVSAVSFEVARGEIVALIGPNGAGKTTLFNVVAGVYPPDEGDVRLEGRSIAGLPPDAVCRAGIARTFQLVRPFTRLNVEDNVVVGALAAERHMAAARARAEDVLRRLELWQKRHLLAESLTLPDRKCLELARSLATGARLLLLDETMAGLRPTEVDRMVALLGELNRASGLTILLIEHVMRAVMALAGRIVVLHHGVRIAEGPPSQVVRHPEVLKSYLGEEAV
ncbi:MAG TPA: ABC transporter ATP-binding protein [Alphaproteobacteria bacterium]|nr:ABC transporter ATP-binding protein [Alphaproteobacteria bacterium]